MESLPGQGSSPACGPCRNAAAGSPCAGGIVPFRWLGLAATLILAAGCNINRSRLATEQLVVSDAVDRAVATIDFSLLSGQKVYFDTQYLDGVNLGSTGNVKYVISSLRQQMLAYNCRLQEKIDTADYVVEARIGVLANDGHEITYGVPGNAALGTASMMMGSPVAIPALPELSLGRRNHHAGTAKIGLFAYDRQTREPVWQAGVKSQSSEARDTWFLGLGPYRYRPRLERKAAWWSSKKPTKSSGLDPLEAFSGEIVFERGVRADTAPKEAAPEVATVTHAAPVVEPQMLSPAPDLRPLLKSQDHAP